MTIHAPQLSITASKVQRPLRFAFSYVQPITKRHKCRTVLESYLQSIQPPWKITMYKRTVGKPCITLLQIDTLGCQQKEWDTKEDKGKFMMRALYVLQYAKRHVSGRSDVEQ